MSERSKLEQVLESLAEDNERVQELSRICLKLFQSRVRTYFRRR